jgi:2-oxo-4-hydroxy-4-carboxy-5-ureidoimidazoline decarboxylase
VTAPASRITVDEIGAMDRERFVATFGGVFERSPWVADRAYAARPFAGLEALCRAMAEAVSAAGLNEQLALIRAHPDLAEKAGIVDLTRDSRAEQASAGLDRCSPAEFERFHRLNRTYRDRFGYPFILAVRNSSPAAILRAFEERLESDCQAEFGRALGEIEKIAYFRLAEMIAE